MQRKNFRNIQNQISRFLCTHPFFCKLHSAVVLCHVVNPNIVTLVIVAETGETNAGGHGHNQQADVLPDDDNDNTNNNHNSSHRSTLQIIGAEASAFK